jgi:tetratricopeptide (TPR) repeat protein
VAAWLGLINAYIGLKDYSKASSSAESITKLNPDDKSNWLREANLLKTQKMYDQALSKFDAV